MTSRLPSFRADGSGAIAWQGLNDAAALAAQGRSLDAIDLLMEANRAYPDYRVEREIVRLRHEAFRELDRSSPATPPPVVQQSALIDAVPPMIPLGDLTPEVLRSGILLHGSLLVRGVIAEPRAQELAEGIDRALADWDTYRAQGNHGEASPWFDPFRADESYPAAMRKKVANGRRWVRQTDSIWGADSPRMLFALFDVLDEAGLGAVIAGYLGERPAMTVDKCTLRRVAAGASADWHQDGSFLGEGIRTVNAWLCLSECGRDAPGLDLVPTRLGQIVETGTEGASFDWSVGPGVVERVAASTPVVRPEFEPGDVLFFDELLLHRTATEPSMARVRYAIETWFFAPSAYPEQYVPLVA